MLVLFTWTKQLLAHCCIAQSLACLISDPADQGLVPSVCKFFFRGRIVDVVEVKALLRGKWAVA